MLWLWKTRNRTKTKIGEFRHPVTMSQIETTCSQNLCASSKSFFRTSVAMHAATRFTVRNYLLSKTCTLYNTLQQWHWFPVSESSQSTISASQNIRTSEMSLWSPRSAYMFLLLSFLIHQSNRLLCPTNTSGTMLLFEIGPGEYWTVRCY